MDVAAALRTARRSAGLGQRQLARRAGLSPGALSRYESGRALPSLTTLDRLLSHCGKDLRLEVVERVEDLPAEIARRASLPRSRRTPRHEFLRAAFLERLLAHEVDVVVAGAWAADLHGIPTQPAEGRLLLTAEPAVLDRAARAFMAGSVPWRCVDGHYGSLPVRARTFAEYAAASWWCLDVGRFRTEVMAPGADWPLEQRLVTPAGPVRVAAALTLGESDGVLPEVMAAWQQWRAAAGPDTCPW